MRASNQEFESVAGQVSQRIEKFRRGRIFTVNYLGLPAESKKVAQRNLSRLYKQGRILRIAHGVYYKPEYSKVFKGYVIPPDIDKAILFITSTNKEVIQLHGGAALNRLGLTSQVPMFRVYHTSGVSRVLVVAGAKVKFIHTANPRLLQQAGSIVGLTISALYYLGKEKVTPEVIKKLKEKLTEQDLKILSQQDLAQWMRAALVQNTT